MSIPKRIIQVWMQGQIPGRYKQRLLKLNPSYQYLFFTLPECLAFLRENCSETVIKTFEGLKKMQHKCDLFRYCYLHKHGGIYLDVDLEPQVSFGKIEELAKKAHFITSLGAHSFFSGENIGECTNGFIMTTPGNPLFPQLINLIITHPNPQDYGLFVKHLYQALQPSQLMSVFLRDQTTCFLFKEVRKGDKYFIIHQTSKSEVILLNSNGHRYFKMG